MDFSLILFVGLLITGALSLGYWLFVRRLSAVAKTNLVLPALPALLIEYSRALFPVILIVFLLRSFVVEPFRIPSGSMLPSLHIGDFILVNKFSYGIRLPIVHYNIVPLNLPERGDVMVFRYPRDPKLNFIKRVIGLPGDTISYRNKHLFINGQLVSRTASQTAEDESLFRPLKLRNPAVEQYLEIIDDTDHQILIDRGLPGRDMEVTVPEDSYFVMGDNRDYSNDSRYWRFVPEENIVGKAFFIWFSWKSASGGGVHWSRIGDQIR